MSWAEAVRRSGSSTISGNEDVLQPNTHAADARAAALVRIEGDAIHNTKPLTLTQKAVKAARRPLGFAFRSPAQITLTPYALYLAAVLSKLRTTRLQWFGSS